jgi:hypothetical protein
MYQQHPGMMPYMNGGQPYPGYNPMGGPQYPGGPIMPGQFPGMQQVPYYPQWGPGSQMPVGMQVNAQATIRSLSALNTWSSLFRCMSGQANNSILVQCRKCSKV